jgi:thiamine-phosphate pyrophosphorylase
MSLNLSKPILYLITPGVTNESTTPNAPEFKSVLNLITRAVNAGIDLIQIREKQLSARVLFDLAAQSAALTRGSRTRLLINDRADIAVTAGAAGVHLTTKSLDAASIRKAFGDQLLIGVSTHSQDEARSARAAGADFIVFGPVFATPSKMEYGAPVGLAKLSDVSHELSDFPVLALGGVSLSNAAECFLSGASGIAGISLFSESSHLEDLATVIRATFDRSERV